MSSPQPPFICPERNEDGTMCGARVELTKKSYWALDEATGAIVDSGPSASWSAYCEKDHPLGDDYDNPTQVREYIASQRKAGEQK